MYGLHIYPSPGRSFFALKAGLQKKTPKNGFGPPLQTKEAVWCAKMRKNEPKNEPKTHGIAPVGNSKTHAENYNAKTSKIMLQGCRNVIKNYKIRAKFCAMYGYARSLRNSPKKKWRALRPVFLSSWESSSVPSYSKTNWRVLRPVSQSSKTLPDADLRANGAAPVSRAACSIRRRTPEVRSAVSRLHYLMS